MTSVHNDDKFLDRFKGLGLTSDQAVEIAEMLEREEILKKYNFDKLKPNKKGLYRIMVKDLTAKGGRKQIYAKDIENLKEKVYRHDRRVPESKPKITFKFAFEEMIKFEKNNCSPERQASRNNTIDKDKSEYRRFFGGTGFENKLLMKITVRDLDEFIRTTIRKHQLSKGGKNAIRTILNKTFKRAYFMGWIDENPTKRLIWRDYEMLLKSSTPVSLRAYTDDEMDQLYAAARRYQEDKPQYIPAYAYEFQNLTAMRRGEICPLRWEDIDLEAGTIYIHQELIMDRGGSKRKQVIVDYTKTHKDRYYPIADLEREFLERLWKVHEEYYPKSPFLFPGDTKCGCISLKTVGCLHERICKKLGITVSNEYRKGPHSFRRNRITEIVNRTNGNAVLAAQMYGNSPETIRKNYYTGDTLERQREALNFRKIGTGNTLVTQPF